MENKEEIDEYNVSKMQGISLFDGYIVMFSALLLCMPGHFPSAKKKWRKLQMHDRSTEGLINNYISW